MAQMLRLRSKPQNPFAPFVRHYGEDLFHRTFHIDPAGRYIYANNPKAACTSTKATLMLAEAARQGTAFDASLPDNIHQRGRNPLLTPQDVGAEAFARMLSRDDVTRFTFVRDPVTRFCSAYLNKLAHPRYSPPPRKRLFRALGLDLDSHLTIEDFAAACAADPAIRDLDQHWRPQRSQIAYDLMDYTVIGRQEHWATAFDAIARRIFGAPVERFDSRTMFKRSATQAGTLARDLEPGTLRHIEQAYEADFAMLDVVTAEFPAA